MNRGFLAVAVAVITLVALYIARSLPETFRGTLAVLGAIVAFDVYNRAFRIRHVLALVVGVFFVSWLVAQPALNTSKAITMQWVLIAGMMAVCSYEAVRRTRR